MQTQKVAVLLLFVLCLLSISRAQTAHEHRSSTNGIQAGSFAALMEQAMERMHKDMNIVSSDDPDRDFAAMMIPHHQGAVDMAKVELQFGKNPILLLGSRRQEVGGMRWSELNLDAGTWALPAARAKNNRAHTVTLPAAALDIIRTVPRGTRDHLFGNRAGAGFTGWTREKRSLDRRLAGAVKSTWRLHDVRRTVATGMADIDIEPHHIEAVLNHHSGHRAGVAGVYNRSSYDRATASALVRWADHVESLVSVKRPATIVRLPKRR
jgi:integrase